jgi:hypothetical protein
MEFVKCLIGLYEHILKISGFEKGRKKGKVEGKIQPDNDVFYFPLIFSFDSACVRLVGSALGTVKPKPLIPTQFSCQC